MQTPVITAQEIAVIARALEVHAAEKGVRRILGAQLGAIINEAIRPKHLREFGGMRKVATFALTDLVLATAPSPDDSDAIFEIKAHPVQVAAARKVPEIPTEVAGADLWRLFSNPRLPCELSATPEGAILAAVSKEGAAVSASTITRPSAEDYHRIAVQFASQQDEPYCSKLQPVLGSQDFYNSWIAALRFLRTPELNLLKRWETIRSEFVSSRLHSSLVSAGIDEIRASEIVAAARPAIAQRTVRSVLAPQTAIESSIPSQESFVSKQITPADELSTIRRILHDAIERMSLAELREVRIPAGALLNPVAR